MTSEAQKVLSLWLSGKQGRDATLYADLVFDASPGRAWSDETFEGFTAFIRFRYDGVEENHYMDEKDVCEFLNQVWAAQ